MAMVMQMMGITRPPGLVAWEGSNLRPIANTFSSSRPSQKVGMEEEIRVIPWARWSGHFPTLRAARVPSRPAMMKAATRDHPARMSVLGTALAIPSMTGFPVIEEVPKFSLSRFIR